MKRLWPLMGIFLLSSLLIQSRAAAWDDKSTHRDLTEKAAKHSALGSEQLLESMGFPKGLEELLNGKSISKWLQDGSEYEDAGNSYQAFVDETARYLNHFHDPTKSWPYAGLDDYVKNMAHVTGESLVLWAQDMMNQSGKPEGNQTWQQAMHLYHEALISSSHAERQKKFADMFKALGFQMHLVQDAAVPEHVRNDEHALEGQFGISRGGSIFFETWAKEHVDIIIVFAAKPVFPRVSFNVSRHAAAPVPITQLVDTDEYTGANPTNSLSQGLAEYANANFFSDDSIFAAERDPKDPLHDFPYPKKTSTNLNTYPYDLPETRIGSDGIQETYPPIRKTEHGEKYTNMLVPMYHVKDILGTESGPVLYERLFYRDEACHVDYARFLIPRAVGYSAELIDYFFRGRINTRNVHVARDSVDNIVAINFEMMNASRMGEELQPMENGNIVLVYKYTPEGTSTPAYGVTTTIHSVGGSNDPINSTHVPMDDIELSPPIPAGAGDISFFLVFQGRLGNEDLAVAVGAVQLKSRIAYSGDPGCTNTSSSIYTIKPDGTDNRQFTAPPEGSYAWRNMPAWSPDGRLIAFNGITPGNHWEIVVVDLTSDQPYPGNIRNTFSDPGCHYLAPSFSPDGSKIVAQRILIEPPPPGTDAKEAFVILDLSTGAWSFLGDMQTWIGNAFVELPKWSPKSDKIVFQHLEGMINGATIHNIWLMDKSTSQITHLTQEGVDSLWPAWSPDGRFIAFGSKRDGGNNHDIWIMDETGVNARKVYDCPADCVSFSFSPDGRKIAFQTAEGLLYTTTLYGTDLKLLGDTPCRSGPAWSPDFPVPAANLTATPGSITPGEVVTLTWDSSNARRATIDNGIGPVDVNGSITIAPPVTTTYTIQVTGIVETSSTSVTVRVETVNNQP